MIHISDELMEKIKQEAERAYPNECCGFIFGNMKTSAKYAVKTEPSDNSTISSERYHRFIITSAAMLKAERFARKNGLDIVGFYHSHPDCPAVPSEYDTVYALPVYSYVIVSAVKGNAEDFTSWELDKNSDYTKFQSEVITTSKGEIK